MLNIERATLMMARVEIAAMQGQHNQMNWFEIVTDNPLPEDTSELIVDEKTGQVIGYGSCQTARCAAGWALHDDPNASLTWASVAPNVLRAYYTKDGRPVAVAACEWLGIEWVGDDDEVDDERWNYGDDMPRLFEVDNTIDDLYVLLAQWWEDRSMTETEKEVTLRTMSERKVEDLLRNRVSVGPQ